MAIFLYKAKKDPKNVVTGEIKAENVNSAISRLKKRNLFPFFIEKKGKDILHFSSFLFFKSISSQDIDIFIRQIASLIRSGLPLVKALHSLSQQTNNKHLKAIIEDLESRIRKGESFYRALSKYSKVFSIFFLNIVQAGEAGGMLDKALNRLTEIREREQDLKNQLQNALTYPALLIIVSLATIFVLLTFIIPKFVVMFEELGQLLPLPTRLLLNTSNFLNKFWPVFLIGIIAAVIALRRYIATQRGCLLFDKMKLRLPLFGKIIRQVEISRFARTFGTLLRNGIPILKALKVTSEMVSNKMFQKEVEHFSQGVERGEKLSELIKQSSVFPASVSDLIAVGEESAELEQILMDISESFEKESQVRIKTFMTVLEPALILILGTIVAFIVISILLPIFEIDILLK